ncbi:AI-2E family transporter [Roseimaritima sediminicola]|uniref:AI-2E family transporter n=1 Tax=Roseimaritima sediminicola TaxID=2662066 RepID=UPI0012982864|nr:AI-2E family transporter [Roseimaritima sediminicola]
MTTESRRNSGDRKPTGRKEREETEDPESLLQGGESDEYSDVTQLKGLRKPISISAVMLTGLFTLALLGFLYLAKQLILPIVVAVLVNFLLSPIVRWTHRRGIPRPVSGLILIVLLVSGLGFGLYTLSIPATSFAQDARQRIGSLKEKLREASQPIEQVQETAREVEQVTADTEAPPAVTIRGPGLLESAIGYVQSTSAGLLAAFILLLFLVCSDELFLHKLVRVLPTLHDKRLAVEIFRQIECDVSYYLGTITLINMGLGATASLLLWMVGVPSPILWGVLVGTLNFIPYLGPGMAMIVLALVGLLSFDELWMAAVPPLVVLGLNIVEANIVTPLTIGNRLNLNPVVIFLSLAFWGFLWGIAGMIIAVPILVTVKTLCDHVEPLEPISEFLAGGEPPPAGEERGAEAKN